MKWIKRIMTLSFILLFWGCATERPIEKPPEKLLSTKEAAETYLNRGVANSQKGEYKGAISNYSKAVEIDPGFVVAYLNRGYTYSRLGEHEKAISDYNKAIELNPRYAIAYNNRGFVYRKMGEYDKAIADFTKAIELDPKYATAYYNRGNIRWC